MSEPDTRITTQLRIEPDLWERVKDAARRRRQSANAYVCSAVERQVREDEGSHGASRLTDE